MDSRFQVPDNLWIISLSEELGFSIPIVSGIWILSCVPDSKAQNSMVGHLFQNYDTIYVRFFLTYTCNHSCYTIYVRFFATYTCVLSYKRAYICAQKSPYICVTNKHVVYGVTESRRIRGTELYRQQKTPSCMMRLKSNFSLNQAWPQWPG